ncbi:hypothetical protein CCMSSC00406_0009681 [Pleurotus cornucopiae]|uniref:Uncharacterized protein n=1 Tax=Pleurotus cornucopiae TaxID=5321 RepID=A0ACB7IZ91_PLECO|nr:hypothetical protein CCMSSC00406_0009681 [Pleurotus cornucopiae]
MKMDTSLIEKHYNRGRPMSDLALHAAQYFRPRKMNNPPIQRERQHQHYEGDNMSGSKRKVVEIADKRNSATSTPSQKNAPEPDTTDTHPTKRAKHSPSQESGARSNKAIALSQSIEAMLARQASKPNAMISRRTRPVHAGARARAGSDAAATATDESEATIEGGGGGGGGAAAADEESAIGGMHKEDGGAAPARLEMSAKDTSSRVRRAGEAPTKGPTTSFASPPKYRK